jgi:hypothetical protein
VKPGPKALGRGRRSRPTADQLALRDDWGRWTDVVELFALRRPGRRHVEPARYLDLHRSLLASCRRLAESSPEAERPYYEALEDLARPWLTRRALTQADPEILASLLARCRSIARELGARRAGFAGPAGMRWIIMAAVFSVALFAIVLTSDLLMETMSAWSRDIATTLRLSVSRSSDVQKLTVVGALIVLYGIYSSSRTRQS